MVWDILPEVGEVKGGKGVDGEMLVVRSKVATGIENKVAHRIGRISEITEHVVESLIARNDLILFEGADQPVERCYRDIVVTDGTSEGYKDRVRDPSAIHRLQLIAPPGKQP